MADDHVMKDTCKAIQFISKVLQESSKKETLMYGMTKLDPFSIKLHIDNVEESPLTVCKQAVLEWLSVLNFVLELPILCNGSNIWENVCAIVLRDAITERFYSVNRIGKVWFTHLVFTMPSICDLYLL